MEFCVEEGAAWSVVSAGSLRRMNTAVLVRLKVRVFALHLDYSRIRDVSARLRFSRLKIEQ